MAGVGVVCSELQEDYFLSSIAPSVFNDVESEDDKNMNGSLEMIT